MTKAIKQRSPTEDTVGKISLTEDIRDFVESQPVFFVASAALDGNGHVNCSPKGGSGTFRVLDETRVAYLDLVGSGVETIAHVRENGRIVVMFTAFEGRPRIVRFHGRGQVVEDGETAFEEIAAQFPQLPGRRAVIVVNVERISTSCGFGVPTMSYVQDRREIGEWCEAKGAEGLHGYRMRKNMVSIDGLPGLSEEHLEVASHPSS